MDVLPRLAASVLLLLSLTTAATAQQLNLLPNPARLRGFTLGLTYSGYANFSNVARLGALDEQHTKTIAVKWFTPEITVGWQTPHGWNYQAGYGIGFTGAVRIEAIEEIGGAQTWSLPLSRLPARITKRWVLGQSRFALGPQLGLVYTFWEKGNRGTDYINSQPIAFARPELGTATWHLLDLKRYNSLSYELGGEAAYALTTNTTFSAALRYTNTFSNYYVARMTLAYDHDGVMQPTIVAQSKLEAWVVALTVRYRLLGRN